MLHYVEDRSVAEIADVLECSVGSVKTHLSRGRAALARALAHDPNGDAVMSERDLDARLRCGRRPRCAPTHRDRTDIDEALNRVQERPTPPLAVALAGSGHRRRRGARPPSACSW